MFISDKWRHIHTKTYTLIFIAAVLVIVPNGKQPGLPSMSEWLNELVHAYCGILLSTKK